MTRFCVRSTCRLVSVSGELLRYVISAVPSSFLVSVAMRAVSLYVAKFCQYAAPGAPVAVRVPLRIAC